MTEEFKSFFNDVSDGNESRRCNYTMRLDTYGRGCFHNCKYCYAKSLLSFRKMWNPLNPAVADIGDILRTIKKELRPGQIVRLGGMTDCFQPAERLQAEGFDVAVRLSPYIPAFVNIDRINAIRVDKIVVEFLRVSAWIAKWMRGIDLSAYTLTKNGYKHLPLAAKKKLLSRVTGFREVTVCEDVYGHWKYWKANVNANPDDCCNLRGVKRQRI